MLYFDDLEVGQRFVSPGRTVTEADVISFAGLSGDYHRLHTDDEYAKRSMFGSRIAHGMLTLTLSSGLLFRVGLLDTGAAFLGCSPRFTAPVRFGDTLTLHVEVSAKRETRHTDRGVVTYQLATLNQRGETVLECDWTMMLLKRGHDQ
ncbi:MAG: MaoC family dehydratase N-terminal domain-containing protein [Chloroflexi bacterium]|nr:MaoC family dehydratase N-terminal domain-containing protein [Chloroflexota bacterium]